MALFKKLSMLLLSRYQIINGQKNVYIIEQSEEQKEPPSEQRTKEVNHVIVIEWISDCPQVCVNSTCSIKHRGNYKEIRPKLNSSLWRQKGLSLYLKTVTS